MFMKDLSRSDTPPHVDQFATTVNIAPESSHKSALSARGIAKMATGVP